ncbi:MAG: helix-turn-helix transcriptional regulator [Patescibacteria group bacterium]
MLNTVLELRRSLGTTQEDFASAIEVSRQTVVAVEKGSYIPSLLLAFKIARYFKKPIEHIFTYTYEK